MAKGNYGRVSAMTDAQISRERNTMETRMDRYLDNVIPGTANYDASKVSSYKAAQSRYVSLTNEAFKRQDDSLKKIGLKPEAPTTNKTQQSIIDKVMDATNIDLNVYRGNYTSLFEAQGKRSTYIMARKEANGPSRSGRTRGITPQLATAIQNTPGVKIEDTDNPSIYRISLDRKRRSS